MLYKIYYQKDLKQKLLLLEANNIQALMMNPNYPNNVIRVQAMEKKYFFKSKKNTNEDLYLFLYEFYFLLTSHLSILESIELLKHNNYSKDLQRIVNNVHMGLLNGKTFYSAIKDDQNISHIIKYFLFVADKTNNYIDSLQSLLDLLDELKVIKKRFYKVLFYPFILLVSIFLTIGILLFFVLPEFESIFNTFDGKLPIATQILLDIKRFILNNFIFISSFFLALFVLFHLFKKRKKREYDKFFVLYVPFYKSYLTYEFLLGMKLSLKSNIQFIDALWFCSDISSNLYLKTQIILIGKRIENGMNIADAFKQSELFDEKIIRLLYIMDMTGEINTIFKSLVLLKKEQFILSIEHFSKVIEPSLILILGVMVLFIVIAILSPVWEMSNVLG